MRSTEETERLNRELDKNINELRFKDLFLTLQIVFAFLSIGMYIASFFVPNLREFAKIVLAILLMIMAYNNAHYLKRKNFTILYLIVGIFFLIAGIVGLIN